MSRPSKYFFIFIPPLLSALLFDMITTYNVLISHPLWWESNQFIQLLIRYLGKESGLILFFLTVATIYIGVLLGLDSIKLYLSEGVFTGFVGGLHLLAGVFNLANFYYEWPYITYSNVHTLELAYFLYWAIVLVSFQLMTLFPLVLFIELFWKKRKAA